MSRRAHHRSTPAGCGQSAGKGLKALAERDFQAALDAVPRLEFDSTGCCRLENPSDLLIRGLRLFAAKPDRKILADTGEEQAVWSLVIGDDYITVIHNRYHARHLAQEDLKRKVKMVGRLPFHGKFCDYKPETPDHEEGLLALIAEQNRLAAKYPGRCGMVARKAEDGRYFISKVAA